MGAMAIVGAPLNLRFLLPLQKIFCVTMAWGGHVIAPFPNA